MAQVLVIGAIGVALGSAAAGELTIAVAALLAALVAGLAAIGPDR